MTQQTIWHYFSTIFVIKPYFSPIKQWVMAHGILYPAPKTLFFIWCFYFLTLTTVWVRQQRQLHLLRKMCLKVLEKANKWTFSSGFSGKTHVCLRKLSLLKNNKKYTVQLTCCFLSFQPHLMPWMFSQLSYKLQDYHDLSVELQSSFGDNRWLYMTLPW